MRVREYKSEIVHISLQDSGWVLIFHWTNELGVVNGDANRTLDIRFVLQESHGLWQDPTLILYYFFSSIEREGDIRFLPVSKKYNHTVPVGGV